MSPLLGTGSIERLKDVHPLLRTVIFEAIKLYDFTVVWGYRGKAAQDVAYESGASKQPWPTSKHNSIPSLAVDLAPWPAVYDAHPLDFAFMAGVVATVAQQLRIDVRWGGDWNMNLTSKDENFKDLGHFELLENKPIV